MKRILVIEDDRELRTMLCEHLSEAGYTVTEAADGVEAAALLRANEFALVITDIYMPNRDGLETITELHQRYPGTRIIAMSGHPTKQTMLAVAAKLGGARTIQKPFLPQEMLDLVKAVLNGA